MLIKEVISEYAKRLETVRPVEQIPPVLKCYKNIS